MAFWDSALKLGRAGLATATFGTSELVIRGLEKAKPSSLPALPEITNPPSPDDPAVAEALRQKQEEQRRRRGRASTVLTSGQGAAPGGRASRTLLGG